MIVLTIDQEREDDGRWLAEILELPGVLAYGHSQQEATARVQALALRVLADRLEHEEAEPELLSVSFVEELGPRMLSRLAKVTGLSPEDLQSS